MQFETPGRVKLNQLGLGPSDIARKLGKDPDGKPVNPSLVSRWLSGTSRPDDVYKAILAGLGYANADDWLTEAERSCVENRSFPSEAPSNGGEAA